MNFHQCKITVVKKELYNDIIKTYLKKPERMKICDAVAMNEEFTVTNPYHPPEGLCPSAWADIRPYIIAMTTGSKSDFMKNPNSVIAICSDPFRPVIFKIERVE